MSEHIRDVDAYESRLPLLFPIWGSHVKRIGLARVLFGGGIMYTTFPFFVLTHVSGTAYVLHFAVAPALGLPAIRARNYLVVDRYRVEGLPRLDKLHCLFCGYANGVHMLLRDRLDQIGQLDARASRLGRAVAASVAASYLPAAALMELVAVNVLYNRLIAPLLEMKEASLDTAAAEVHRSDFARGHSGPTRAALRFEKRLSLRLGAALEQIESAWCPIKHFERMEGAVYPPHHKLFFAPSQLAELRKTLLAEGSVSAYAPSRKARERQSPTKARGLARVLRRRAA